MVGVIALIPQGLLGCVVPLPELWGLCALVSCTALYSSCHWIQNQHSLLWKEVAFPLGQKVMLKIQEVRKLNAICKGLNFLGPVLSWFLPQCVPGQSISWQPQKMFSRISTRRWTVFWGRDQLHMRKLNSSGGSCRGNAEEGCVMWWGRHFLWSLMPSLH